jgi:hypothetical protein
MMLTQAAGVKKACAEFRPDLQVFPGVGDKCRPAGRPGGSMIPDDLIPWDSQKTEWIMIPEVCLVRKGKTPDVIQTSDVARFEPGLAKGVAVKGHRLEVFGDILEALKLNGLEFLTAEGFLVGENLVLDDRLAVGIVERVHSDLGYKGFKERARPLLEGIDD